MGPLRGLFKRNTPAAIPIATCPLNKWQLTVKVTREAKPARLDGSIDIDLDDNGLIDWASVSCGADIEKSADFEGGQAQVVQVSARSDNLDWYCSPPATVNLVLGNKSAVTLHFKPKPWVKFKVVEDVTKTQLAGLTLRFTLPSGQVTRITSDTATTDAMRLDPAVTTVPVDELDNTADARIWEFVRIESAS